jgi:ribonucleoside-diphosphate reductase alpha chain
MGVLNIDHPDIEEFIVAKRHEPTLNNFNLSVAVTDAFMHSVEAKSEFNLVNPKTGMTTKTINAVTLWNMIVENAWSHGDPGLIFIDTINRQNPLPSVGRIEATNPCGEVPLFPYEACNLGSINLSRFVRNEKAIDWILVESVVNIAVRFLDDVIEISNYLLSQIKKTVRENRKIGLGIMGWADLLVQLNIPYDSEEAINLAEQVISFIKEKAIEASAFLARERGTFPNWNKSIYYPSLPLRNATLLSIAPTGSISIIADTSSSIEPLFAIAFERKNVLNNATLPYINQYFLDYINGTGYSSNQLIKQVIISGKVGDIPTLPAEAKEIFKTALEISPDWHLKHQLIFQKYVDNAVSKTINLPPEANPKDISTIFMKAWKEQAKGITVFRYHSKEKQVLEVGLPVSQKACKVCTI